jgi:nitrilase
MSIPSFPAPYRVAAVQASPVYLDSKATARKACELIREAACNGARLVAFPEVFIPGYPYWAWMMNPFQGSPWFKRLYLASIAVDGEEVRAVQQAAAEAGVIVVIGINERSPVSMGTIYNTNLTIGADGTILGRHRKIVPTFAEKIVWGSGDGSSIRVHETALGRVGSLACGENTNTLARFALLSQGEQVHIANYVSFPFRGNYDMPEAIKIRAGAHSFEGKVFTLVASSTVSAQMRDMLGTTPELRDMLSGSPNAFSGIFGPDGRLMTEPLIDIEGIVYAEIDLERCIELKQYQDIIGHYQRFDIFELHVNRNAQQPLHTVPDSPESSVPTENEVIVGRESASSVPASARATTT